ncbi:MAG: hypothetical protein V4760_03440, partial [Bdellovibrionota bacterium]
ESRPGSLSTLFSTTDFMHDHKLQPGQALIFEGRDCRQTLHLNSIQIVQSNWLLLGLGDFVVMWNLEKKKAEWIFAKNGISDFEIPDEQAFALIHSPTWIAKSSRLVIFDNGQFKLPPPLFKKPTARILDFKLDTKTKKILSAKITDLESGVSEFGGGIDVDGEIVSVALGRHKGAWDVQEIKDGKSTMSFVFGPSEWFYNYRVYRSSGPQ